MGIFFITGIIVLFGFSFGIRALINKLKPNSNELEKMLIVFLILSLIVFAMALNSHSTPYSSAIDPFVEPCYSPIAYKYSSGLLVTHLLSLVSLILLYFKEYRLPPIPIVVFIILVCIGILLNFQFLFQISYHDTSRVHLWENGDYGSLFLSFYPILLTICSIGVLIKLIKNKSSLNTNISYKNKQLDWLNNKLVKAQNLPLLSILLTIPVLLIIVILLTIFGQDLDSFNKVYTETATWRYSQHLHPPTVDDRHGHYLCTVAALGNPKFVKPLGIGKRKGKLIIINRQLQIANAFEYLIEEVHPRMHQIIRKNYDKYGINLAKRVNNKNLSNITYFLMKPLEWFFLFILYSSYIKPEEIIKRQYKKGKE